MLNDLIVTRRFAAPPERIFQAWTTPEEFAVWFGTEQVSVPLESVSLDAQVGGQWRAEMHIPDGPIITWAGTYTEVDSPHRLVFTMTDEPGSDPGPPVVVTFTTVDGGTEMTLVQTGSNFTPEQQELTIAGYHGFFDVMEKLVSA